MTPRKIILSVILTTATGLCGMAQSGAVARGDRNFAKFEFSAAAENYASAVAKDANNISAREKLARTYVLLEDHRNAEIQYAFLAQMPKAPAIDKLHYGLELRANGKYAEAQKAFNEYLKAAPDDSRAKELSGPPDKVSSLATDNRVFEVTNMSAANTEASDMAPSFYNGGIVFSSNRGHDGGASHHEDAWTSRSFYDLYQLSAADTLAKPVYIKGKQPNRKFHEGSATFTQDGKEMYFTRSNYVKGKATKSQDKIVKLQIMHADWSDARKQWINVKPINLNSSEYDIAHPSLSKDGNKLYFISDMPGSLGGTDLYVSERIGSSWGTPVNLGKDVNTKGREMFPFIAEDNTLYYASDGLTGLGGLDIYAATYTGGKWTNPQNPGTPINTRWDDFGYITNTKNTAGYLTSNRERGKGEDDLYRFTRSGVTICGAVVDAQGKAPLGGAEVRLTEGDNLVQKKKTGEKGEFCFAALPNKDYKISAQLKEYETNSTSVPTGRSNQTVQLQLTKAGGITLTVCVHQRGGGTVEGALVELTNKRTGTVKTCTITADCKCKFDLDEEADYRLCASKDAGNARGSYTHPCQALTTSDQVAPANLYENMEMVYLEENMTVKIDNLYYDLGKWDIRPDAARELDKVVDLMKEFPAMQIELSSHTDCRGNMLANDELSAKRAQACVDYLIANGIDKSRLTAIGYGERHLVNNCACEGKVKSQCTEEEHAANRRTEFKIIKLK
ncbi:MAG: OmpA family protein [Bacteroidetes bacterium]|nr:OmpA family protein [Bacteroidota bacterium]